MKIKSDKDIMDWVAEIVGPVSRYIAAIGIVFFYIFKLKDKISTQAVASAREFSSFWQPNGAVAAENMVAFIYLIHVAVPTGFILVLLLSLISSVRPDHSTTYKPTKGLGWIWVGVVIALALPFGFFVWK